MTRAGLLAFALCAGLVQVQAEERQDSSLMGLVTDSTGAVLPQVALTLTSPSLIGGARKAVADERGLYRFPGLVSGLYELTAERRGFKTIKREAIRLATGTTLRIDLQLDVAPVSESTTVTGASPIVEVTSAASSTHLDDALLQNLPTVRQQPESINLIPGVEENVAFGGTQHSNALLVDGVGVSEPKLGSSFQRLLFNYNWIQEIQAVALGANAEYGEFTGLAANSIVRSGANRVSALGEYWMNHPSWVWSNTAALAAEQQYAFRSTEILTHWDSSAQVGGPLKRDRLWFFGGFQYVKRDDLPAGLGGAANRARSPKMIAKLTAAPSATVRLDGFFEHDWSRMEGAVIGAPGPAETLASERSPGKSWNARLTWLPSERTLLELRHNGYRSRYSLDPMSPNSRSGPSPHLDLETGLASGNVPYYLRGEGQPLGVGVTVTRYADRILGSRHELKVGAEYQRTTALDEFGFPGGRWYLDLDGAPFLVYLFDGSADRTTSRRATLYAQDTWTVGDRVTIHPGLRLSINRGAVPERGTVFGTNPVSPRLGVAWDVLRDRKMVLRAHYGRYP